MNRKSKKLLLLFFIYFLFSRLADCEGITFYQTLSNESNIYVCELCGDGFLSQQLLQQHFTVHGKLRIMCDKCPKIFKNDSALKAHFK